tara:strand:+ start:93 stop:566 length:474 start_codon:yes stop_codon:yes gene_type:complete
MNYNFSIYESIEDLEDIKILHTQLLSTIQKYVSEPYEEIYIVGSFCFNVGKSNDIDIMYCIPEEYKKINYPSNPSVGYDMVNYFSKYEILLSEKLNKKIQLIPNNKNYFLKDAKSTTIYGTPPIFDLVNLKWINKKHGDVFNKRLWNEKWITRFNHL